MEKQEKKRIVRKEIKKTSKKLKDNIGGGKKTVIIKHKHLTETVGVIKFLMSAQYRSARVTCT